VRKYPREKHKPSKKRERTIQKPPYRKNSREEMGLKPTEIVQK
jgi:hypothetical protein